MTDVTEPTPDWRRQKTSATRRNIRFHALRLFREHGYDATTVEQVSAAAGVSHMTFFRYFPTKEDVVLSDEFDPLIIAMIRKTPATQAIADRIQSALLQGLSDIYDTERDELLAQNKLIAMTPALRTRLWGDQMATQELLVDALGLSTEDVQLRFRIRVTVAVCLAAAATSVMSWAENDGSPELPELIEQAFSALRGTRHRMT